MKAKVGIISYGVGNIGSISNMLDKVGANSIVISSPEQISICSAVILPGVGAFDYAMSKLEDYGWVDALNQHAMVKKKPILGICLGMHLLTEKSEEGKKNGLGFIDAETMLFSKDKMIKKNRVPHMSWNLVNMAKENKLFDSSIEQKFYFVHSYHVVCKDKKDVLTTTNYGYEFVSSFSRENIIGVQFHPEKSHHFGCDFLKQYIKSIEV